VSGPRRTGRHTASGPSHGGRGATGTLAEVAAAADHALAPYARPGPGRPRFEQPLGRRAFVLEAVYEGYLLHYGEPRLFDGMDGDLRLLAGDSLYALGLARLAEQGDLPAVAELSELITRSARAHAEGRAADAEALWDRSAGRLAAGPR
jgi:hypothetical protein